MSGAAVYILDRLVSLPGQGRALHAAYLEDYAPGARARGMTLVTELVSPPVWQEDGGNTLVFLWRVEGAAGFWKKNNLGRRDPAVRAWWAMAEMMILSRSRDTLADPADFAALADV
ncbi:MAG: hypothetical protein JWP35_3394 [Caulobacter sp.]|nr:hypothetical protein [Caulobacter sp.]